MEIRELNEKEMISIDGGKNWRKIGEGIIEVGVGTISITGHIDGPSHDAATKQVERGWRLIREGWNERTERNRSGRSSRNYRRR